MHRSFQQLRVVISAPRLLPHIGLMLLSGNRTIIQDDVDYWAEILHLKEPGCPAPRIPLFLLLMTFLPEFRTLFYLRALKAAWPFRWMCPPLNSLKIEATHIGPRLFIQHGENTFISADSIGANCWIGRHVIIGYSNDTDRPSLGNYVRVLPGARIIGKVHIGDSATIGLNTVVLDNVSPGVTLFGVPGRPIGVFPQPPARRDAQPSPARAPADSPIDSVPVVSFRGVKS